MAHFPLDFNHNRICHLVNQDIKRQRQGDNQHHLPVDEQQYQRTDQDNHNLRNAFASYYGIAVSDQIMGNVDYVENLMRISLYINSTPGYSVNQFINELQAYQSSQLRTNQSSEIVAPTANPAAQAINAGSEDTAELITLRSKMKSYGAGSTPQMATSSQDLQQQK